MIVSVATGLQSNSRGAVVSSRPGIVHHGYAVELWSTPYPRYVVIVSTAACTVTLQLACHVCSRLHYFLRPHAGMGAKGEVAAQALIYLRCRCIATPAILSIFVAIGTFRGFQDTKCVSVWSSVSPMCLR